MKQSKKQDVAIAKLNMAIGDIANQLIKNNIKLPRKNPRYANKLGKKLMRGGGEIDPATIASIKNFLQVNKDTVIQLKNKLILDILELYKYIVELTGRDDVDYEIIANFKNICDKLIDNSKNIYDYTFDTLYSPSKTILKDSKYSKYIIDLANIDNTKYILKLINIYYLIFINNKDKDKDTISFENNTTNLEELFKDTIFINYSKKAQHPKDEFVNQCDTFIRNFKTNSQVYSGNTINNATIALIIPFLEANKNIVILLKNKLILDIYDYMIKCCSNDPDAKNYADIYIKIKNISTTLFDNTKGIYDYNLNKDIYAAKELGEYVNKKIKENDINNTIYILQFINIYYTIFDKNKKITDTDTFGNNTINLDELFKGTLFEYNTDIEKNKKNFVGAYDTFKRRIEGDEKIVVEQEDVRNDKEPIVNRKMYDDLDRKIDDLYKQVDKLFSVIQIYKDDQDQHNILFRDSRKMAEYNILLKKETELKKTINNIYKKYWNTSGLSIDLNKPVEQADIDILNNILNDTKMKEIINLINIVIPDVKVKGSPAVGNNNIISNADKLKSKVLEYYEYDLYTLKFLTVNDKHKTKKIRKDFEEILKTNETYMKLKIEGIAIDEQIKNYYKKNNYKDSYSIVESTQLITRIDKYIAGVENFKPALQKLYDNYIKTVPTSGGNPPAKYKSTGIAVHIMYKKRKYKRTVYVKEMKKTKYCKIDGEYILLSKMKVIA
jgi:hypothetical protein